MRIHLLKCASLFLLFPLLLSAEGEPSGLLQEFNFECRLIHRISPTSFKAEIFYVNSNDGVARTDRYHAEEIFDDPVKFDVSNEKWMLVESILTQGEDSYYSNDDGESWQEIKGPGVNFQKLTSVISFDEFFNVPIRIAGLKEKVRTLGTGEDLRLIEKIAIQLETYQNPPEIFKRKISDRNGAIRSQEFHIETKTRMITRIIEQYGDEARFHRMEINMSPVFDLDLFAINESIIDIADHISRPALGAAVRLLADGGFLVEKVLIGSPADEAGLNSGDIIYVDEETGSQVDSIEGLSMRVQKLEKLTLKIVRSDGSSYESEVTPKILNTLDKLEALKGE